MNYQIFGDEDNPIVEIALTRGEQVRIESGAMVYMQDVDLEGRSNSNSGGFGGFLPAVARPAVTGEGVFITTATGITDIARIAVAPATPGMIAKLEVGKVSKMIDIDGWGFIVKKEAETGSKTMSFEQAYDKISWTVRNDTAKKAYDEWIARLKDDAFIKIYPPPKE